jgi:hypothetical protein
MEHAVDTEFDFEFWLMRQDVAYKIQYAAIRAEEKAKGNPEYNVVCRYWLAGTCSAGARCFYKHVYIEDQLPLCAYINAPPCQEGASCKFRHFYKPGEQARQRQDPQRS